MADLASVTKMSQINYEKGERSPDAAYLEAIAAAGADVQYIITGRHGVPALTAEQERAHYVVAVLSPAEAEGLEKLRRGGFLPAVQQTISGNANQVVGINNGSVENGSQAGGKRRR